MKKLIVMTEYIDWIEGEDITDHRMEYPATEENADKYSMIVKYKYFIQTTVESGQFVPCNSKGEPLEEPKEGVCFDDFESTERFRVKLEEYQEALDRCLFKDWEKFPADEMVSNPMLVNRYKSMGGTTIIEMTKNGWIYNMKELKTIEDFLTAKIPLTLTDRGMEESGINN